MPADDMDDFLEARAASVETSVGETVGLASMNSLTDDFDDVFQVFHDVLRYPAFAEDKLEVAKAQSRSGVARRNDDVGGITSREFRRLVYGADSPLSRQVEYATLDAIGREIGEIIVKVAAGAPTRSEALGHQEFALNYKTFEPAGPACFPA